MTTTRRAKQGVLLGLLALAAGPVWALSVSLTAPANNAVFAAPAASIALAATATPTNSSRPIAKVEFFRGTTLIGADTTAPYSITWTNVPAGTYSLTAKATDSSGATATSKAVSIKVDVPPTVSLTSPANNAVFSPGSNIALAATAADSDGTISKVEFFRGTTLLGTDTTSPYSFTWTNVATGSYTLTAKATDNNAIATSSAPVTITVDTPPTVSISAPANNALFIAPASVTVSASASDTDGTVAKVDFFDGATPVGTATAAPFSVTLSNVAAGTHALTARATDNLGLSTTSAAVTIRVDAPPGVSITAPANGAVFTAPATIAVSATASDADGTVAKVDFFDGAALIGTATAAPYGTTLANAAPGTHTLTARATDNNGAVTTSAAVSVIVNTPPTVSLTAPANGAVFQGPATITVTANAADTDGTVSKVDFFDGATLVGTATATPYSVTLANVAAGAHSFTARATDNQGASTTSAAVGVTVDAAPAVNLTAPAANAVYAAPGNVTLTATATDSVGTIAKVDFYQGTILIGTATTSPYSFNWTNVPAGNYSLTAIATDDAGGTTTSAPVAIKVDAAPVVNLTAPANNAVFAAPAAIALSAAATDTVGAVAKVDFYQGTTLIGTATAAPYSFNWTGVAAGPYSLTAVATNDAGMTTTSSAVAITVDAAPSVAISSPASGASFTAPANVPVAASATDSAGTVTKVDFYRDGTLITTLTAAPYSFTWTNVPAGNYSLTAVATNDAGTSATSAAVAIAVNSGVAQIYYIHPDHLNTPRLIADSTGTTVWRWDQGEPFGNDVPNADPNNIGTTFDFPLRFPGQYFDRETNLNYNMRRDYDPAIGGYKQSDPIGLRGGINTYAYVDGNPLRFVDPSGTAFVCIPGGGCVITPPPGGTTGGLGSNSSIASGLTNLINKIIDACTPDDKPCPPCKLVDGTIVPIGTIGYRPEDTPPDGKVEHGISGPHLNLYKANQNPNNCQCFWQPIGAVPPPPQPNWIPIQPFAN